jgi:hypothetical protein
VITEEELALMLEDEDSGEALRNLARLAEEVRRQRRELERAGAAPEPPSDMERLLEVARTALCRARTCESHARHVRELCTEIVHLLGCQDPEVREIAEELAVVARSTMQVSRMGEVSVRHAINDPTLDALLSAEAKAFRRILDRRDRARRTGKDGRVRP